MHIPYKGNADAERAVLAGDVQALFGSMPAILQQTKAGKMRPLGVGSSARSPALPDVPTVAESGYAGFEATLWLGVSVPTGTPKPIVDRLESDLRAIVAMPDFREALARNGADPLSATSADFAKMIAADIARTARRSRRRTSSWTEQFAVVPVKGEHSTSACLTFDAGRQTVSTHGGHHDKRRRS